MRERLQSMAGMLGRAGVAFVVTLGAWGILAIADLSPLLRLIFLLGALISGLWTGVRAVRWVAQKAVWRLRHRLIITYLFVAVAPVLLLILLGLFSCYSLLLQDADGQVQETHSVSAGLDYPGVGPEHAFLHDIGRAEYTMALDDDALDCVKECSTYEGVLPALESAHALWGARELARRKPGSRILVGMSGRGDKDMPTLQTTLLTKDGALS